MRFAPVESSSLSSFAADATYNLLSNASFILDAIEQSKQILNVCVTAPAELLSHYSLSSALASARSLITSIYDFVIMWEDIQHIWSTLFVAFNSSDVHTKLPTAQRIFETAQEDFFAVLKILNKTQRIDIIFSEQPEVFQRAADMLEDFISCRTVFEEWLIKKRADCPRLLWLQVSPQENC